MSAVLPSAPSRRRVSTKRVVPLVYIGVAMAITAVLLPSALRPPPDQTSQSAALSPDAPPEEQAEQVIQSVQQAAGGGAGAAAGEGAGAVPQTTTTLAPASGECVGSPPRQNFSVYSNGCAPAFAGDNGGSTYKNVFPDEIRIGWYHGFGGPGEGRLPDDPEPNESPGRHTFRVFQTWLNQHFQLWGRRIVFYGIEASSNVEEDQARVQTAVHEYKLFSASHAWLEFCREFARNKLPMFCVSAPKDTFAAAEGYVFSYPNVIDQAQIAGAEFVCKTLFGRPAVHAGSGVDKTGPRRIAYAANYHARAGAPKEPFDRAYREHCGEDPVLSFEFNDGDETQGALAVQQMIDAGVTTVVTTNEGIWTIYMQQAADALGWQPEWVYLANWGADTNTAGKLFSPTQQAHAMAISGWEIPLRPDQTECYRAYHEIDPDTDPAPLYCAFWQQLVLIAAGIQGAGPNLNPDTFRKGLHDLGYRCGISVWMSCGGFGPNDPAYMDDFGVVWWDPAAIAPDDGGPGAYRWVANGDRYRIGEFPGDDSQLFKEGILTPE